jgi:hypothetical protein
VSLKTLSYVNHLIPSYHSSKSGSTTIARSEYLNLIIKATKSAGSMKNRSENVVFQFIDSGEVVPRDTTKLKFSPLGATSLDRLLLLIAGNYRLNLVLSEPNRAWHGGPPSQMRSKFGETSGCN